MGFHLIEENFVSNEGNMPTRSFWCFTIITMVVLAGCETIPSAYNIISIKSNGVLQIPKKLGVYPFLSTDFQGSSYYRANSFSSLEAKQAQNVVEIVPKTQADDTSTATPQPVESGAALVPSVTTNMSITSDGQILSDLFSTDLSTDGFSLQQLPIQMQDGKNPDQNKTFCISMDLLNNLRSKYGIEAIALCDAFFTTVYTEGGISEKRVVAAHVKIIDTNTLDVLGQVTLPYNAEGKNMNETASRFAESLAQLADLPTPTSTPAPVEVQPTPFFR